VTSIDTSPHNRHSLAARHNERHTSGIEWRDRVPIGAHGEWQPPANRPDPIEILIEQGKSRIAELLPIRYARMKADPFAFLRGAAAIMAGDLASGPATGLRLQTGGDCHLANFGAYATPEGTPVFDMNDFDETLPAPFEWDVKRLAASATDDIIDKGRRIASFLLETGEIDIEFEGGRYRVAGTDRDVGIFDVAAAAATRKDLPEDLQGSLAGISDQTLPVPSFPYGTQVCEVEVDPETGEVEIVHYAAVDDVGRAINPLILHGQTHGGIAQGVGQALLENIYYEPQNGQLLTASFMDYAMPRADTLPFLATALSEVPTPTNRLGVRSGGEGGTTPALAAVINAIVDALAELGVRHVEMPATPERVWRAIRAEGSAAAAGW
jgi:hypothetical protein